MKNLDIFMLIAGILGFIFLIGEISRHHHLRMDQRDFFNRLELSSEQEKS